MKRIYTLGYGWLSFDDFVRLLKENGIETVVDVRRFPTSKDENFRKENLSRRLPELGLSYEHIQELGGFRGGYERYMRSAEFREGIEKLKKIAEGRLSVVICVEENPAGCHRRHIAKVLEEEGWEVVHLRRERSSRSGQR